MQPQLALYIASVAGAVSLYLLMPKPGKDLRLIGGLLGAATLGLLWLVLVPLTLLSEGFRLDTGFTDGQTPFYYLFSAIAVVAAVRVITHHRPVYSALWFVMVVIAAAGLLLTLSAEFMAFAMLIIYGGAILVTYMFVIMLATPPRGEDESEAGPSYDRIATEPWWACVAGFLLLAVILSVTFRPMAANADARLVIDANYLEETLQNRSEARSTLATPSGRTAMLDGDVELSNVELVGIDLFRSHPLAIELAGIILLLALVGAVVIAKTHVKHIDEPLAEGEPAEELPTASVSGGGVG
jgi:NADH-quinone oxidoreductase subunit J